MAGTAVAVFCMPGDGHFRQLLALIADLAQAGFAVHVFTHQRYAAEVERAGATMVDLFAKYPIDRADPESIPIPCRNVSFAAFYAEPVLEELKALRPAFVIYETFAVIGRLVGRLLGIPYINVSAGHALHPARYVPILRADAHVAVSEHCRRAVEILRGRYGLCDASPFSYVDGLSPYLNICCEPPEFLTDAERRSFEPVAFYGSLASSVDRNETPRKRTAGDLGGAAGGLRIYACFGTIIFRYFADLALRALEAVAECVAGMPEASALISLGGGTVDDGRLRRLKRSNVEVVAYADQWRALGEADVFLTHNGMNSTHEAIVRRVPMLSYPFFADQPALAERCQEFGTAIPLVNGVRGPIGAADVRAALQTLVGRRDAMMASLERARSWEFAVMARRPAVLARILELGAGAKPGP